MLLRPKTGLKDMYLALDPGTRARARCPRAARVQVANTLPDVNSDEFLAQLDSDTRAYLQILLNAGGTTFDDQITGRGQAVRPDRRAGPARDVQALRADGARRRRITRLLIAAPPERQPRDPQLPGALDRAGRRDKQLASLVDSANSNFEAFASEEGALREAIGCSRERSTRPSRRSRRPARWPASSARRSSAAPVRPRSWHRRSGRRSRSSGRPRRSSATRSARSRATCSRSSATCARPPATSRS